MWVTAKAGTAGPCPITNRSSSGGIRGTEGALALSVWGSHSADLRFWWFFLKQRALAHGWTATTSVAYSAMGAAGSYRRNSMGGQRTVSSVDRITVMHHTNFQAVGRVTWKKLYALYGK